MWQVTTTLKATTCDTTAARPGDVHVGTWRMNVIGGRLAVVNDDSPRDEKDDVQGPTVDENGKHRIVLRSYQKQGSYSDRADLVGDDHELTGAILAGAVRGGPVYDQTLAKFDAPSDGTRSWAGTSACAILWTVKAVKK